MTTADASGNHGAGIVFANANVLTLDAARPRARSVQIAGDRIVAVSADPDPCTDGDVARIDCRGSTIVPGFVDAHVHIAGYARSLAEFDAGPGRARTIDELQRVLRAAVAGTPEGEWITGRGWDDFILGRAPTRTDLDAVAPRHPVSLQHRSGHAQVLNSVALARVGIGTDTGDPEDGLIDRDPTSGDPTGLLFGMQRTVAACVPRRDAAAVERGIARAAARLRALGVTALHDTSPGNGPLRLEQLRQWRRRGLLPQRVHAAIGWEAFEPLDDRTLAALADGDGVRLTGVKLTIHERTGRLSPDVDELARRVARIHASGLQALMHAVEPPAIEAACAAVERALRRMPHPDARHRIEHASVCPPPLARRIADAGIVVVTQPGFIHAHGPRYCRTVDPGDQPHLYPLATLLSAGVVVAASSDAPAGPADPLVGMRAAVSRRGSDGVLVGATQAISPRQALPLFALAAAQAMRAEHECGSLRPGRFADFVVLSGDPTAASPDTESRVLQTVIGGRPCSAGEAT